MDSKKKSLFFIVLKIFFLKRCGIESSNYEPNPVFVMNDTRIKSVHCGEESSIVFLETGEVYVFGVPIFLFYFLFFIFYFLFFFIFFFFYIFSRIIHLVI